MYLLRGVLGGNTPRKAYLKTVSLPRPDPKTCTDISVQDGHVQVGDSLATCVPDHLCHHCLLGYSTRHHATLPARVRPPIRGLEVHSLLVRGSARLVGDWRFVLYSSAANDLCLALP